MALQLLLSSSVMWCYEVYGWWRRFPIEAVCFGGELKNTGISNNIKPRLSFECLMDRRMAVMIDDGQLNDFSQKGMSTLSQ
jgi:hypothetical protein